MADEKQGELFRTVKGLKPRERRFLKAYMQTKSRKSAYLAISPNAKPASAEAAGSRMMRRVLEKLDEGETLDEFDLGRERLYAELGGMIQAEKQVYHNGHLINSVPDNSARMQALLLLADIHGLRKQEINQNTTFHGHVVLIPGKAGKEEWERESKQIE